MRSLTRLTITARLVLQAAAGVLGLLIIAAVALTSSSAQSRSSRDMASVSEGMSAQWNADMLHDGIRADVMSALVAGTPAQRDQFHVSDVDGKATDIVKDLDAAARRAPAALKAQFARCVRPARRDGHFA